MLVYLALFQTRMGRIISLTQTGLADTCFNAFVQSWTDLQRAQ
jgi:hypothetical protein